MSLKVGDTGRITIAGAGLAGTLLAVLLSRKGFGVDLFERNPDPREDAAPGGRSINLALAERGRNALNLAGLLEQVDAFTIPMRGRMLHDTEGQLTLQPYGKDESEVIWSTHRARLNITMLDAAEASGKIRCYFDHLLSDVDWAAQSLSFSRADGATHQHQFEVLIGADGGGSAVRQAMASVADLGISEEMLGHGYLELSIPANESGDFQMDPHALHIWPRGGYMLIALPNSGGSFTVTLFLPNEADAGEGDLGEGGPSFGQLTDWPRQKQFMQDQFPDAMPLLAGLEADFRDHPVGLLGTIRCRKWFYRDQAVLLGDAAHAVVPFHGQGMNAAFEDCVEFINCLENTGLNWAEVFERYQERRIDDANAIADMALENYAIMRESVRDPRFLLMKKLEHELERRHPQRFIGRYALVMFHTLPYAQVYQRGLQQAIILDRLLEGARSLEQVDFELADRLVVEQLQKIPGLP